MQYGLSDRTIADLQTVFRNQANIRQVLIFGSRAKGNYRPGSDIDLALVGDGITLKQRNELLHRFDDMGILYKIDLVDYNKKIGTPIGDHINRVGQVLYSATNENVTT